MGLCFQLSLVDDAAVDIIDVAGGAKDDFAYLAAVAEAVYHAQVHVPAEAVEDEARGALGSARAYRGELHLCVGGASGEPVVVLETMHGALFILGRGTLLLPFVERGDDAGRLVVAHHKGDALHHEGLGGEDVELYRPAPDANRGVEGELEVAKVAVGGVRLFYLSAVREQVLEYLYVAGAVQHNLFDVTVHLETGGQREMLDGAVSPREVEAQGVLAPVAVAPQFNLCAGVVHAQLPVPVVVFGDEGV